MTTNPFTIDRYFSIRIDAEVGDLGDITDAFHVCGITPGAKDTSNTGVGFGIM